MIGLEKYKQAALFEKSAQKLLLIWATGVFTIAAQIKKSFFASFCSQKEVLSTC
jgi:hypothetical protein